jgi:hypothetical protein
LREGRLVHQNERERARLAARRVNQPSALAGGFDGRRKGRKGFDPSRLYVDGGGEEESVGCSCQLSPEDRPVGVEVAAGPDQAVAGAGESLLFRRSITASNATTSAITATMIATASHELNVLEVTNDELAVDANPAEMAAEAPFTTTVPVPVVTEYPLGAGMVYVYDPFATYQVSDVPAVESVTPLTVADHMVPAASPLAVTVTAYMTCVNVTRTS